LINNRSKPAPPLRPVWRPLIDPTPSWHVEAHKAFAWFTGANDLGLPLVDIATGSCRDGLHPDRANENRGAESLLAYLLSLSDMQQFERDAFAGTHSPAGRRCPPFITSDRTLCKTPFFNRHALHLRPDPSRVVVRPFGLPRAARVQPPTRRANHAVERVLALTAEEAEAVLVAALANFDDHAFMLACSSDAPKIWSMSLPPTPLFR
jgi:hypothetical protein